MQAFSKFLTEGLEQDQIQVTPCQAEKEPCQAEIAASLHTNAIEPKAKNPVTLRHKP